MRPTLDTHASVASAASASSSAPSSVPSPAATPDTPSSTWTDPKGRRRSTDSSSLLSAGRSSHHRHGPLRQLRNALSSVPDASGLGVPALAALARDVYAVATGLRKAHLVDKLTFTRHSLDELAHTLVRVADEGHLPELRNIVLAFEPITQSTFICNRELIRESADETIACGSACNASSNEMTQWRDGKAAWLVAVGDRRPELLRVGSAGICPARSTLLKFAKDLPSGPLAFSEDSLPIVEIGVRHFVPTSEVPRVMVCIAGWCCAYPVVYVLPERLNGTDDDMDGGMNANALAGEPLWIIKARLFGLKTHDDHVLVQCSMPESIFALSTYSTPLSGRLHEGTIPVSEVSDRMQTQLEARLEIANQSSRMIWDQVEVTVEGPVVLDRVSL